MAAGDVWRMTIVFGDTNTGKRVQTKQDFAETGLSALPALEDIGAAVDSWWNTAASGGVAMKGLYAANVSVQFVEWRKVDPLSSTIDVYTGSFPTNGTSAGDALSPAVAIVVTKKTALAGRRYRGRSYLPPFSESQFGSNGRLTSVLALQVATQFGTMLGTIEDLGDPEPLSAIVWSRTYGLETPMTSLATDRIPRSQRRRQQRAPGYSSFSGPF